MITRNDKGVTPDFGHAFVEIKLKPHDQAITCMSCTLK